MNQKEKSRIELTDRLNLPCYTISNEKLTSLSFNSNMKLVTNLNHIDLNTDMSQLNLADSKSDKCDFFSDIDENINLDAAYKYYDTTDINNMTQSLNLNNTLSILHTNIQSLNCNGEKLETLLHFDIVAVSETWKNENKKHLFNIP